MVRLLLGACLMMFLTQCDTQGTTDDHPVITDEFADYWFAGKAEVASYKLVQARYGEPREGHAVLIFVTEPFSRNAQVKLDDPDAADKVTVMKLNMIKKFVTGIYPYSMMLSTFSPADNQDPPPPLKYTMTSQEWCGHVFAQLNRRGDDYQLQEYSYFQSEGDNRRSLPVALTEDEIWNRIRLDPSTLPVGEISIYPGLFFTRLMHREFTELQASASLGEKGDVFEYVLRFAGGRTFTWYFEKSFPHTITGWEERYLANDNAVQLTTATLLKRLHIPYWEYNDSRDIIWRDSLLID